MYCSYPYSGMDVGTSKAAGSEAELLRCYPALRAEDLTNTWAYYRNHRAEIERQIRENDDA